LNISREGESTTSQPVAVLHVAGVEATQSNKASQLDISVKNCRLDEATGKIKLLYKS